MYILYNLLATRPLVGHFSDASCICASLDRLLTMSCFVSSYDSDSADQETVYSNMLNN